MQSTVPGQHIPKAALDHYNSHFDKYTYNAFRDRLQAFAADNPDYGEAFVVTTLNLLIDACLCRSGTDIYRDAEQSLKQFIQPLGPELLEACQDHLANFGPPPDSVSPAPEETARTLLLAAQVRAEEATRAAADIRSWRGHVAFAWSSAAAYLLHAASIMLIESHYDSYPLEKFDKAMVQIRDGIVEANDHRVAIASEFVIWIRQLLKTRV
jgi:hypothetical protein